MKVIMRMYVFCLLLVVLKALEQSLFFEDSLRSSSTPPPAVDNYERSLSQIKALLTRYGRFEMLIDEGTPSLLPGWDSDRFVKRLSCLGLAAVILSIMVARVYFDQIRRILPKVGRLLSGD